jgi:hypothetical protein
LEHGNGWFVPELNDKETFNGRAVLGCRASFEAFSSFRIASDPCMISHVLGYESTNHQIPEFKDGFVGLAWNATLRDGSGFDDVDSNLNTVRLKEEIEMIEG